MGSLAGLGLCAPSRVGHVCEGQDWIASGDSLITGQSPWERRQCSECWWQDPSPGAMSGVNLPQLCIDSDHSADDGPLPRQE